MGDKLGSQQLYLYWKKQRYGNIVGYKWLYISRSKFGDKQVKVLIDRRGQLIHQEKWRSPITSRMQVLREKSFIELAKPTNSRRPYLKGLSQS